MTPLEYRTLGRLMRAAGLQVSGSLFVTANAEEDTVFGWCLDRSDWQYNDASYSLLAYRQVNAK